MGDESNGKRAKAVEPERSERRALADQANAAVGGYGGLGSGFAGPDQPLTVASVTSVQRRAGNRAATELVQRHAALQHSRRASTITDVVQRAVEVEAPSPEEAAPEAARVNDPGALAEASEEALIALYLTDQPSTLLAGTDAAYSLKWVQGGKGSAQIRDSLLGKLRARGTSPDMHQWAYGLVAGATGPSDRIGQLESLVNAAFMPRDELDAELTGEGTRRLTNFGYLIEMESPGRRSDPSSPDRPLVKNPKADMERFEGVLVHPDVIGPLSQLLAGLRAEGARLNDASALRAKISSGWRGAKQSEGNKFLTSIRATIKNANNAAAKEGKPRVYPEFPEALEAEATSELGSTSSAKFKAFRSKLADSPGWNATTARAVLGRTARFKAPSGGSSHHSGFTVDINFPVWALNTKEKWQAQWHNTSRVNNPAALRTVAGRWLYEHAPEYDFDSYDTEAEIWHMEWRKWKDSRADADSE